MHRYINARINLSNISFKNQHVFANPKELIIEDSKNAPENIMY